MPGFYVNHLKSQKAKEFAPLIETHFRSPHANSNKKMIIDICSASPSDLDDVLAAAYAVHRDNPDIFYFNMAFSVMSSSSGRVYLSVNLLYSLEKITLLKKDIEKRIQIILSAIDRSASKWEQERQLFEYMQTHIKYVNDGSPQRYNIVGSLVEGKSVCEGISKMFAVLCHRLGIPCIVVFSKDHMWNLVNIDGRISHVDVTYGTDFGGICDYSYFNIPDSEIFLDHVKEIDCIPICNSHTDDFYRKTGTFFDNEYTLKKYLKQKLPTEQSVIHLKLGSGNIARVIEESAIYSFSGFQYTHNQQLNTATIYR